MHGAITYVTHVLLSFPPCGFVLFILQYDATKISEGLRPCCFLIDLRVVLVFLAIHHHVRTGGAVKVLQRPKSVKWKDFKLSKALGTHNIIYVHLIIFPIQGAIHFILVNCPARRGKVNAPWYFIFLSI